MERPDFFTLKNGDKAILNYERKFSNETKS